MNGNWQNHLNSQTRLLRRSRKREIDTKRWSFITQYLRFPLHKWQLVTFCEIRNSNYRLSSDQSYRFCLKTSQIWMIFEPNRVQNHRFQPKVIHAETLEKFSERCDFHFLQAFFTFRNQVSEIDFKCRICSKSIDFLVVQMLAAR